MKKYISFIITMLLMFSLIACVEETDASITSIKITTPPTQLEYTMGEEKLNLEGMVVTATDKDGKTSVVKNNALTITGFDSTTSRTVTVTVSLDKLSDSFEILITQKSVDNSITSIELTTPPLKLEYAVNDEVIDLTGLVVTATHKDESTSIVDHNKLSVLGFNTTNVGLVSITLQLGELTVKFDITVTQTVQGRQNAPYYVPGVPLVDDAYVVYINFDGVARYYWDELLKDTTYTPVLSQIMAEGVFFDNIRTALPSVTNPLQNAILSGTSSEDTKNVYRYYDKDRNVVVQQGRENAVERLTKMVIDANITTASVAHYLAGEDGYSTTNINKLYVNVDNTIPSVVARGSVKNGDYFARFEQAIRLIKGEPIKTGSGGAPITVTELPHFILLYCDDLDAIGHNESAHYGFSLANSEAERVANTVAQLKNMDAKLGEFIQAAKDKGIYDKMTFFLTTDHGMTGFGDEVRGQTTEYRSSKLPNLKNAIKALNPLYSMEFLKTDETSKNTSGIVAVGTNLNVQLTWRKGITDEELERVKTELLKEDYIYSVLTRTELEAMGYWTYAADMIITPSERYNFSNAGVFASYSVRAQHDSMQDSANHIIGWVWGKGIKKGLIYEGEAYNYDFGVLMAATLGLEFEKANGVVLDIFEQDE